MQQPPFLKPNAIIGITSTARKISLLEIEPAIKILKSWGFRVEIAPNIGLEDHQFAGNDEERTKAFQGFLDNPKIDAIICARGGYGSVRILDLLDWSRFKKNPKWICGYSDVTAIHSKLHQLGFESLHSTMPINFESNTKDALETFRKALTGSVFDVSATAHNHNKTGKAKAQLVGGNLSMLYSLLGSPDQINTNGKILFIEDLDEYLYHIDRMMMALKRAGMLRNLAGLVIGGMTDMNDNTIPFGKTAVEIIAEHLQEYHYPIGFNFNAGHLDNNQTLILGSAYTLEVTKTKATLLNT